MKRAIERLLEVSSQGNILKKIDVNSFKTDKDILKSFYEEENLHCFGNALHFFDKSELDKVNKLVNDLNVYPQGCLFFAEDVFGNLFCEKEGKYYLLDLETGDLEFMGNSLDEWADSVLNDYEYYTGYSILKEWEKTNIPLNRNERLVPKRFFVLGGEYDIKNLYSLDRLKALKLRADLYKQIKDIDDGEQVIIEVKDNKQTPKQQTR